MNLAKLMMKEDGKVEEENELILRFFEVKQRQGQAGRQFKIAEQLKHQSKECVREDKDGNEKVTARGKGERHLCVG